YTWWSARSVILPPWTMDSPAKGLVLLFPVDIFPVPRPEHDRRFSDDLGGEERRDKARIHQRVHFDHVKAHHIEVPQPPQRRQEFLGPAPSRFRRTGPRGETRVDHVDVHREIHRSTGQLFG